MEATFTSLRNILDDGRKSIPKIAEFMINSYGLEMVFGVPQLFFKERIQISNYW